MKEDCWIVLDIFIVYGILIQVFLLWIQILLFHILWWAYPHVLLKILLALWMDCNIHFCGNNDSTRNTSFVVTTNFNYIKQFWRNCVTMINLNSHPRLVKLTDSSGGECRSAAFQSMYSRLHFWLHFWLHLHFYITFLHYISIYITFTFTFLFTLHLHFHFIYIYILHLHLHFNVITFTFLHYISTLHCNL